MVDKFVVEQRYQAVLAVLVGATVNEILRAVGIASRAGARLPGKRVDLLAMVVERPSRFGVRTE